MVLAETMRHPFIGWFEDAKLGISQWACSRLSRLSRNWHLEKKVSRKKFRRSKFEVESMGVDAVALFQGEMKSNSVRYTP